LEFVDFEKVPSAPEQTRGAQLGQGRGFSRFQVHTAAGTLGPFELNVPGRHNVLNATAAVAIARQLGVEPEKIAEGLANFRGVDRRFQQRGAVCGVAVVDDYGHHPTEIRATLAAARECCSGRIHVVFQPHRYSRTADLMDEFSIAFSGADTVIVLPIYAASEDPIPGVTAERLAKLIQASRVEFAAEFAIAVSIVAASAREGDLILTLGAGSVSQLAPQILAALEALPSR
jgi:UDP-N-acetylmuramate--alanine ligase